MKILLTGASSFTGCWFARSLAEAGHDVVATFTRASACSYDDALRQQRVERATELATPVWNCRFGDDLFLDAIGTGSFDLVCHHAADVTDYRSEHFDYASALASNTHRLPAVLDALKESGCDRVLLTGTVFQGGEGAGSEGLPHFSPYGLSKALTMAAFEHFASIKQVTLGKFIIPNPFGPWEEPRFTSYLIRTWKSGEVPCVRTPAYVRDNIHASLLARCYVGFAEQLRPEGLLRYGPTGYIETQGAFTRRFASEMAPRLGIDCPVELSNQTDFPEPRIRVNNGAADLFASDWDETQAWDELAEYYKETFFAN